MEFHWTPANESQRRAVEAFANYNVIFLVGPAGCGKTSAAVALGLREIKRGNWCRQVYLTRPLIECDDEQVGFLKGDLDAKLSPWEAPFRDVLSNMFVGPAPAGIFEFVPLAYIRGRTLNHGVAILDEAQNLTLPQWRAYLSRMGERCKTIVCGDPEQSDLDGSPMEWVIRRLAPIPGVAVVRFGDNECLRNGLVPRMLRQLRSSRGNRASQDPKSPPATHQK